MKKHKTKIIISLAIAVVLALAFFHGGNLPAVQHNETATEKVTHSDLSAASQESVAQSQTDDKKQENIAAANTKETSDAENTKENQIHTSHAEETDKYPTEPAPEGKPAPEEAQERAVSDTALSCTLSVRCDTILDNRNNLDKEKLDIVPKDGIIFAEKTVTFYEGESVFNVLVREMKRNKIHMEFVNTPVYNSAYIEGIANIYEFDCGELSGWMYKVNGWFPNYGSSRYVLKEGDKVEWVYTCDLGKDVGGSYSAGNGRR